MALLIRTVQLASDDEQPRTPAQRTTAIQCLRWCISNFVGRYDARGNVYPRKARPEQKIDAAVAFIMAIARCMAAKPRVPVCETRGIQFVG